MKFIISGKNIDVTDGLRSAVNEKIGKLERYFTDSTEIHVTLSTEKERQKIEVTIPMKGNIDSLNASVAAGILAFEVVRQSLN